LDVAQFLPVRKPIARFLSSLHQWLEEQESMTASLWLSKLEDLTVLLFMMMMMMMMMMILIIIILEGSREKDLRPVR